MSGPLVRSFQTAGQDHPNRRVISETYQPRECLQPAGLLSKMKFH